MECIRERKKMLYSVGEIALCEWEIVEMIQKNQSPRNTQK